MSHVKRVKREAVRILGVVALIFSAILFRNRTVVDLYTHFSKCLTQGKQPTTSPSGSLGSFTESLIIHCPVYLETAKGKIPISLGIKLLWMTNHATRALTRVKSVEVTCHTSSSLSFFLFSLSHRYWTGFFAGRLKSNENLWVHYRLHIYPLCGIFYFPWYIHQIEGTTGVLCLFRKT